MKITKKQAIKENWDEVKSWNYKLGDLTEKYQSVVYAELGSEHSEVETSNTERIYFIIDGSGEFDIAGEVTKVEASDVITIPPSTKYNYWPTEKQTLKILVFMELWDN